MAKEKNRKRKSAKTKKPNKLKEAADEGVKKKEKTKKKAKKGRKLSNRKVETPQFYVPDVEWAGKRLEEEGDGLFKLKPGKNNLVMLPSIVKTRMCPWVETKGHYTGGKDVLQVLGTADRPEDLPMVQACLKFHEGERCGNCDLANRLKKAKRRDYKSLGGALYAGLQCYANVVDLKNIEKGVQPFKFGWTIAQVLLSALDDGDIFCDPRELKIISIRKEGKGINTKYTARVTNSVFGPIKKRWLGQIHDLEGYIHPIPSPEEITEAHDILLGSVESSLDGDSYNAYKEKPPRRELEVDDDDDVPF